MGSRNALLPAYALSAVVVVTAALGSLVFMETATVKLSVPTSKLTANLVIKGGTQGHDLVTTSIQADVTDSQQGTTTVGTVPPTFATGQAVFTCSPCPAAGTTTPIPEGSTVSTTKPFHYATQSDAEVSSTHTSVTVAIRALAPGIAGNTAANTITVIDKPITNVKVANTSPTTGGAESTTGQVVQQSDLDRVKASLATKVISDLDGVLKAQAGGLSYIADGQPTMTVVSDHKVGDPVATFIVTIAATQHAIAYSQAEADALLRTALMQRLPKGFQLTTVPIQTSYQIQKPSASGDVTINGSAIGVMSPSFTADELKSRIKGMRIDKARQQLELLGPGTTVDISVRPRVPFLPLLQNHINLTIVLQGAAPT
jgi:hypothetical protein